ncbi:MAG: TonB-dependent receptor plug domain-containing protein, partial [Rhodospirillaceae bacterium]|nr:TonB-dependent receptor plug domain-containing protein [Rhodospirillaceae bacterium]
MPLSIRRPFRLSLLAGCAALAAMPAAAQPNAAAGDTAIEEIVVRGVNLQRLLAVQAKREAEAIIDAVSADDLGRLPDRNTAESLARLPGVSITQDQGEGRYVSIRGASPNLNAITLNGLAVGTVEENSRRVPLDILGGELLGGLEVVKAVTPDLEANAVGGSINVKTPSPFDFENRYFGRATAQVGKDEYSTFTPYSGNATIGGKFGADETIGVLVGVSYTDRHYLTKGLYVDDWREVPGLARGLPESHKLNDYDLDRERLSLSGALEIKPDDDSLYFLRAIWTEAEESELRYRNRNYFGRVITPATRFTITPGSQSGTYTNQRLRIELRAEDKLRRIGNFSAGGE